MILPAMKFLPGGHKSHAIKTGMETAFAVTRSDRSHSFRNP
jgi:hypothetical protein